MPWNTSLWSSTDKKWIDPSISYAVHLGTIRIVAQHLVGEIGAKGIKKIDEVMINVIIPSPRGRE
jgi:hypothetical protein